MRCLDESQLVTIEVERLAVLVAGDAVDDPKNPRALTGTGLNSCRTLPLTMFSGVRVITGVTDQ